LKGIIYLKSAGRGVKSPRSYLSTFGLKFKPCKSDSEYRAVLYRLFSRVISYFD